MNLTYTHGRDDGGFAACVDPQRTELVDVHPEQLCFFLDGTHPILRVAGGSRREFPVLESFTDKLLRWHGLRPRHLQSASNETAISFFNDLLLAIRGTVVRVCVVDGEAATITHAPRTPARR